MHIFTFYGYTLQWHVFGKHGLQIRAVFLQEVRVGVVFIKCLSDMELNCTLLGTCHIIKSVACEWKHFITSLRNMLKSFHVRSLLVMLFSTRCPEKKHGTTPGFLLGHFTDPIRVPRIIQNLIAPLIVQNHTKTSVEA